MADIKLCAFADEAGDSLAEQITAMQENGIGLLELRSIDKKNVTKFTNEEIKEYKAKMESRAQTEEMRNTVRTTVGSNGNIPTNPTARGKTSMRIAILSYFPIP